MPDFNGAWFRTVGNIMIASSFFNLYYPIIEFIGYYMLRWQARCRDRKFRCYCSKITKSTSIQ
jgi:hypothetical protein